MANEKRKDTVPKRSNSNTQNDDISNVKTEACINVPDLPIDIIVDIISRLHVKLIVACTSLSKVFKNLISDPSFSHIYHTNNKSNSFHTIFVDRKMSDCSLDLIEFDTIEIYKEKGNYRISTDAICNTKRVPGGSSSEWPLFSVFGYCNGLFCLVTFELGLCNLFVINPLLGEFIQLPQPVFHGLPSSTFSFGIGYCQLSNRYKVLRILTYYPGGSNCKSDAEIFTIGVDRTWRSLANLNVPYNRRSGGLPKPSSTMVSFRSVLHWMVKPIRSGAKLESTYICAFDMKEEKESALQLPPNVIEFIVDYYFFELNVLLDKLCLWRQRHFDIWVMDEYGVKGSWTKQFLLNKSNLPTNIDPFSLTPLIVLPEGVVVLSNCHKMVFYDTKKEKCLRAIHQSMHACNPILFVPSFVSLRNLVQGPGLMLDVHSCSLVSEMPQAFPGDQLHRMDQDQDDQGVED